MRAHRQVVDYPTIEHSNYLHLNRIDHYRKILAAVDLDPDKRRRHDVAECALCFYQQGRMAGAAFTTRQCAFCDEELKSGSTDVNVMCLKCAVITGLCKHCGADVDYKNKRKRSLPDKAPTNDY